MRSLTDGEETVTEIEIATEKETSVVGEWMTTKTVMIQAVIGRYTVIDRSLPLSLSLHCDSDL